MTSDPVTLRIDPHVHSEASYDARDPVELLLEQAADIGLDGIVVTDHNVIEESIRAAELAAEYGLIGIPGVEVSTKHGHVLAIGVEELPPIGVPLSDTVAAVRELDGVAVVAHPFQWTRHGARKKHITDCDAVEVYNTWLFTGYKNRKAAKFADSRGYPPIGSSDAHGVELVGRAYTEIKIDPSNVDTGAVDHRQVEQEVVLDAIRNGATSIEGTRKPIHDSAMDYGKGAARKTAHVVEQATVSAVNRVQNVPGYLPF